MKKEGKNWLKQCGWLREEKNKELSGMLFTHTFSAVPLGRNLFQYGITWIVL